MDDHTEAPADSWMGWSNGHWEGDTLVIDTTGFNDLSLVRSRRQLPQRRAARRRAHHGAQCRHAFYEATIEDPKIFTRPWKISMPLYRRVERTRSCWSSMRRVRRRPVYGHLRKHRASKLEGECTCCVDFSSQSDPRWDSRCRCRPHPRSAPTAAPGTGRARLSGRAKTYKVPRTARRPSGPQGFWTNATYTPLERPDGVDPGVLHERRSRARR